MSFLDRIRAVNTCDLSGFCPFTVAAVQVGFVRHTFAEILTRWPAVFRVEQTRVSLAPELDSTEARTEAVNEVLLTLASEGMITGWRNEPYPVNRSFGEPPYLLMERAAAPLFGICAYGVHMNGFVRTSSGLKMWIARRALDKPTDPGKLDQLVAGGQPFGISLKANLTKECWEEASIPAELAGRAVSVGAVSYCRETLQGLRPDVLFNFDLELSADFMPVNRDGEVEEFYLWPVEQALEAVRDSDAFKFNCSLVVIDFLIRHGVIPPEHPDYMEILQGLLARERILEADARRRYQG